MIDYTKSGVIYCAFGEIHLKRALISAASFRKHNPDIQCGIVTDKKTNKTHWDHVIINKSECPNEALRMIHKIETLILSPYEYTLYLDTDTFILDRTDELFALLKKYDLAICHGHNRLLRYKMQHGLDEFSGLINPPVTIDIPYSFSPLQGGVIVFKKNKDVIAFLEKLKTDFLEKNYFDDQAIIRKLLWEHDLKIYILPPEYNTNSLSQLRRWRNEGFVEAIPKIFHYTRNKHDNIEKVIRIYLNKSRIHIFLYNIMMFLRKFCRRINEALNENEKNKQKEIQDLMRNYIIMNRPNRSYQLIKRGIITRCKRILRFFAHLFFR